jgi:hypothetical protein
VQFSARRSVEAETRGEQRRGLSSLSPQRAARCPAKGRQVLERIVEGA